MAWLNDPGAVPLGARPLTTNTSPEEEEKKSSLHGDEEDQQNLTRIMMPHSRGLRRCPKCSDNFKPPRAHHDSVTGRCIVKFDHFCPWIGNAVGVMNHKFFFLFILYTLLASLFSIFIITAQFHRCGFTLQSNNKFSLEACERVHSIQVKILLAVSIIFMIFTSCMLAEQLEAILTGTSKIARLKLRSGRAGPELERVAQDFNETFGGDTGPGIALHWFLPLRVTFPSGNKSEVMGYEFNDDFPREAFQEEESNQFQFKQSVSQTENSNTIVESSNDIISTEAVEETIELSKSLPRQIKKRSSFTLSDVPHSS
eukprot:CAMPEP_0184866574 /NCGR_PEP_ID=MMETSP0580-20130426/22798_1 /TAXON_ID=1118495 /ORGANISM="Dactyliosolen fragilissimus" /LENGTH=312 /DNA_ID=CAMNT_0027366313 /DNA_START=203 /DNA_END=1141 /DNA_ORIENTATION=+